MKSGLTKMEALGAFDTLTNVERLKNVYLTIDEFVKNANQRYIKDQLTKHKYFFNDIDGKSLDQQQRLAVVTDEESNLVLAGAGGGKTLTISAKVKYLVECKSISPDQILLISFTKKSAQEMQERITERLNLGVEVKTFHKLGLDIISFHRGQRPDIMESMRPTLEKYFKKQIYNEPATIQNLLYYFGCYLNVPQNIEEFKNLGDYHEYCRRMDLQTIRGKMEQSEALKSGQKIMEKSKRTFQGEQVKSIEEAVIANYLYLNGIPYEYEAKYPYDTGDPYRKSYCPDFYLPDSDIYLEHFGIDEEGQTPWLEPIDEKKYQEGITWKRELHKKYNTKLIETYSYFNKHSVLHLELGKLLDQESVQRRPRDFKEIYEKIYDHQYDRYFLSL